MALHPTVAAVTATTAVSAGAAVERLQGWGRQLALTPMGTGGYAATKVNRVAIVGNHFSPSGVT